MARINGILFILICKYILCRSGIFGNRNFIKLIRAWGILRILILKYILGGILFFGKSKI